MKRGGLRSLIEARCIAMDPPRRRKAEIWTGILLATVSAAVLIGKALLFPESETGSSAALFLAAALCAGVPALLQRRTGEPLRTLNYSIVISIAVYGVLFFLYIALTKGGAPV